MYVYSGLVPFDEALEIVVERLVVSAFGELCCERGLDWVALLLGDEKVEVLCAREEIAL